jgi:hypothetical protein
MPLPIPWTDLGRCALAAAGMALAVSLVPAAGGIGELLAKAAVGVLAYGALAFLLDASGLRSRCADLVRSLQSAAA